MVRRTTAVLLCVGVLAGCDGLSSRSTLTEPSGIQAAPLPPAESAKLEAALRQSPEVRELTQIRDQLTERARQRGVTPEMVRTAYAAGDIGRVEALFGMSSVESAALAARMSDIRQRLLDRHPALRSVQTGNLSPAFPCDADAAARALGKSAAASENSDVVDDGEGGCKWVQYTAALVVCSGAGPVLYWPCAYVAMCSLCPNGACM